MGRLDWTVVALHSFWDSWLHERDILLATGMAHRSSDEASFYATAYGVFIAAVVASMFGEPVQQTLKLSRGGGGVFDLDSSGGATTLTATPCGHWGASGSRGPRRSRRPLARRDRPLPFAEQLTCRA